MLRAENKFCLYCNKTMPIIGLGRKNGKKINNSTGRDWTDDKDKPRLYHKKCWKILDDKRQAKIYYEELLKMKQQEDEEDDDDYQINI